MRILLLTQWFDPEPCFKGLQFAKALQAQGHSVSVLTGFPNYPGGKLYRGYRVRCWQRETMEGIEVLRVPLYPSHSRSAAGRIANYGSFAVAAATLGLLLTRRADVVYVYHPPATVGLPAMLFRLLRRTRVVYDIQDLWPDTLAATGMVNSKFVQRLVGAWCALVYRVCDRIVVLSPGFKRRLVERGVPVEKVDVIYNWADERTLLNAAGDLPAPEAAQLRGKFNILFAGNLGSAQALDTVLEAAKLTAVSRPDIQFVFVGDGIEKPRLEQAAAAAGARNVVFLPRRTPVELEALYVKVDALLVHLRDDELFTITIPSKTQAYLLAGLPIIMAVRGDAATLVQESAAGLTCEPENAVQLAETAIRLATLPAEERKALGKVGRAYYDQKLALAIGVERFGKVFATVAARDGAGRAAMV
jgi:glycosyltransferase involved in cell wall biosynthesis